MDGRPLHEDAAARDAGGRLAHTRLEQDVRVAGGDDVVDRDDEVGDGRVALAALQVEIDVGAGNRVELLRRGQGVDRQQAGDGRVERNRGRATRRGELDPARDLDHAVVAAVDEAADRDSGGRVLHDLAGEERRGAEEDRVGGVGDLRCLERRPERRTRAVDDVDVDAECRVADPAGVRAQVEDVRADERDSAVGAWTVPGLRRLDAAAAVVDHGGADRVVDCAVDEYVRAAQVLDVDQRRARGARDRERQRDGALRRASRAARSSR